MQGLSRGYYITMNRGDNVIVRVEKEFRDKENDLKLRRVGEEFKVPNERAIELEKLGFVERMRTPVDKEAPEA